MAIAMSGDIDFDQTIRLIDQHFGKLQKKPLPEFKVAQEQPIAQPVVKEVHAHHHAYAENNMAKRMIFWR